MEFDYFNIILLSLFITGAAIFLGYGIEARMYKRKMKKKKREHEEDLHLTNFDWKDFKTDK